MRKEGGGDKYIIKHGGLGVARGGCVGKMVSNRSIDGEEVAGGEKGMKGLVTAVKRAEVMVAISPNDTRV